MEEDAPLVSIVTPVYNEEKYLRYTLDSVKEQTYKKIEHIVVDDGSTDATREILQEYEGKYDLKIIQQPNKGRPSAMNKGFDHVSGDIVFWLNGDDIIFSKNTIKKIASEFTESPEVDVIYGNRAIINSENHLQRIVCNNPFFHVKYLLNECFAAFNYMRREVIDEFEMDTEYNLALDYDFFLKMASEGMNFHYMNSVLYCYRTHEETTLSEIDDRRKEAAKIREKYNRKFDRLDDKETLVGTIDELGISVLTSGLELIAAAKLFYAVVDGEVLTSPIEIPSFGQVCFKTAIPEAILDY